jgi:hypothetical protein
VSSVNVLNYSFPVRIIQSEKICLGKETSLFFAHACKEQIQINLQVLIMGYSSDINPKKRLNM